MSQENYDFEATFKELKKSSQASLSMVVLGALALIASLIYSGTRLAPLEEEIRLKSSQIERLASMEKKYQSEIEDKSKQIETLAHTESDYLRKIEKAKTEYAELKENIEQLYAVRVTKSNKVYELKAAAKATGQVTSNGPAYLFSIFINAPEATLNKISKVKYVFNHPTFTQKVRTEENPTNRFTTEYYGWGCLTKVSATLYLIDGEMQNIDFNMCQSLGPQWWGEDDVVESAPSKEPIKRNASNIDCGVHWASWDEIGGKIGNPCPPGCYRGEEVNSEYRTTYRDQVQKLPSEIKVPQKIPSELSRRQFQCWKIQ